MGKPVPNPHHVPFIVSLLSFLVKQGSTLFLYLHPLKFQDSGFGSKLAWKEKSALIPPSPIIREEKGAGNPE